MEYRVDAHEIADAAKRIKAVGDRDLRLALTRSLRQAAQPAVQAARASAGAHLPKRGGLAARVAAGRYSVAVRTGARSANVTVKSVNNYDIRAMDRGRLRHKVFGRKVWVTQAVDPGWFTEAAHATAPIARQRIGEALHDIQKQLKN